MKSPKTFKVLSLNGGGMRGLFTTAVLVEIQSCLGDQYWKELDLIVGTSTGGIIALGLAAGKSPQEMMNFYRDLAPQVFSRPRYFQQWYKPKYGRQLLDNLLQREFGNLQMGDLEVAACIPSLELIHGTPQLFMGGSKLAIPGYTGKDLVWKVAAATSAAPTYFAPVQLNQADSHIDGGVWANNPALVGIIEAVRSFKQELKDIRLLSIGTTFSPLRIDSHPHAIRMGKIQWAQKAFQLLQGSSTIATHLQARLLLPEGNYYRIDTEDVRGVKLDNLKECLSLQEWGRQAGREHIKEVKRLFD